MSAEIEQDYEEVLFQIVKDKGIKADVAGSLLKPRIECTKIVKADQTVDFPDRGETFEPNEAELALINQKAIKTQTKDGVITLTIKAAGTISPTDDDEFELPALYKMAEQAKDVGLPILLASDSDPRDHTQKATNTKGIVYDAFVKDDALYYKAYFPKSTRNLPVIEDILNGLLTKVSVGFYLSPMDYHCSVCNVPMVSKECPHQPGEDLPTGGRVKALIKNIERNAELSLVAVPARTEARAVKMSMSEESMSEEQVLKVAPATYTDILEDKTIPVVITLDNDTTLETIKTLEAQIVELRELVIKLSSTSDRIINDDTILDNTMAEETTETVIETKEDIVPVIPDSEVKPAVESHQTVEAPHHEEFKKAVEKLDGLSETVKSLHDNHLAILGYCKDMYDSMSAMHGKIDLAHAKHDTTHGKLDEVKDSIGSRLAAETMSFEQALAPKPVIKSLSPNSALLERLHISQ